MQKEFYEALSNGYQPVALNSIKAFPKKLQQRHVVHAKKQHSTGLVLTKKTAIWLPKNTSWAQTSPQLQLAKKHQSMTGQLEAPLTKGEQVGWIKLQPAGMPEAKVPVQVTKTIQKTFF